MSVKFEHPEYCKMIGRWKRCRDVADGQDAVHFAGPEYLPRLKEQSEEDYRAYVLRTPFYNATWRTIAGLTGMLFRKPAKLEVPEQMKELLKDVTMDGVPFDLFAQEVCEEALKLGRLGLLVDYPVASLNLTLADAKTQNLRPMMHIYRAESIINWRTGRVNNVTVLTLIVLKEKEAIQQDEFEVKFEDRYRVLDLEGGVHYRVRIMKIGADGKDVLLDEYYPFMNGKPLDYIPFTFLSTTDNTTEVDEPPLIDLVNLNLSHYRTSADFEHGAHFTGLPTPVVTGWSPPTNPDGTPSGEKLYIGSQTAWVLTNPEADAKYLEFTGTGLTTLKEMIEHKEKQMAVLGARMLEPMKKGVETAEAQSIHRKGEESMLAAAARSISLGMQRALEWFRDWANMSGEVEYELNRDFYPAPMTPQMLAELIKAWQSGAISYETLFENLQYGEVISEERTIEEEQAAREEEAPQLQGQEVDPVTGEPKPVEKLPKEKQEEGKKGSRTTITTPKGEKYTVERN